MSTEPQRRRRVASSLLIATALVIWIAGACITHSLEPEEALRAFYDNQGPEETLMDPLILAADKVVPLVIEKIRDKKMPRRRYAIGFLGNDSYREALPVLQAILQDSSELDYFRADALHSIYLIEPALGLKYAEAYKNDSNDLGKVSQDLLSDRRLLPPRRTYRDAWLAARVD